MTGLRLISAGLCFCLLVELHSEIHFYFVVVFESAPEKWKKEIMRCLDCSQNQKQSYIHIRASLPDIVLFFSFCVSADVPCSLVLCLLCQGFIWQLHEEHNYTARKAIWYPQLSDWHHRRQLWNRWVSQALCVHFCIWWLYTLFILYLLYFYDTNATARLLKGGLKVETGDKAYS